MSRPVHVLKDRYELHKKIARGGMAEVFLARDRVLDRPVAVKIMFPEFATDPTFVERFRREAQSAARLSHPNIVGVYDWGEERGTYFLVMEYINGPSVSEVLRRDGPFSPKRAAEIAADVASALGAAHEVGVIHRDIKPGNIMLNPDGRAKVTDFGIARLAHDPDNELTKVGSVMGTATYFSPEQAQGFSLDGRSDLYSLGGVLFEMLTGQPPFSADSPVAIAYKHVQERPPRPASLVAGIPLAIEAITLRLLTKNPESRYDNAQQLVADLKRFRMGQPTVAEMALRRGASEPMEEGTQAYTAAVSPGTQLQSAVVAERMSSGAVGPDDAEYADEPERSKVGMYAVIVAVLLALLVGLGLYLKGVVSPDDPVEAPTIEVPTLSGRTEAEATQALTALGLKPVSKALADAVVPASQVIKTDPAAGAKLEKGAAITIFVWTGPPHPTIPLVTDRAVEDAKAKLAAAGFTNVTVEEVESDDVDPGIVVSQVPPANTPAPTTVAIVLRVASEPKDVDIPKVAGLSKDQAIAKLNDAGFTIGSESYKTDNSQPKGLVIGTDPSGTAKYGSALSLVISAGPESVVVPKLIGLSESEARRALEAVGLKPSVSTQAVPAGSSNDGKVIDVSPAEGDSVLTGSTVAITVAFADAAPTTTPTTAAPTTAPTTASTSSTTTSTSSTTTTSTTSTTTSTTPTTSP